MKILLISTAYNGLTQRAHLELAARGYEVFVELAISDAQMTDAVALIEPDIVICPFLKSKLPEAIWRHTRSVIIHPGIVGDRGPSSLDWAIHDGHACWGVTAFEANDDFDAGDVWASESFPLRMAPKASIYRQEVTDAAIACILRTIDSVRAGERPTPLHLIKGHAKGRLRPAMAQADRAIDWQRDSTQAVIRKIHAADSFPGVLCELCGLAVYLYGAHEEVLHRGNAGDIVAQRDGAVCIATSNGAVWVSKLQERGGGKQRGLKLPAAQVLGTVVTLPTELPATFAKCKLLGSRHEIWYDETDSVGYLHFDFHNGAMSTEQCQRLQRAFQLAKARPTQAIALVGGVVAARSGRIFNPHYKTMGLRGSEYWTYLLPRRIGCEAAHRLTESCLPISAENAFAIGLVDVLIDARGAGFMARLAACLREWCEPTKLDGLLRSKRVALPDAAILQQYRLAELAQMHRDFKGPAYRAARKAFVFKAMPTETPSHLAPHRRRTANQRVEELHEAQ